jgi:hypothetical protein
MFVEVVIDAIFCVFIAGTESLYCIGSVSSNAGGVLVYLLMLVSVSCSLLTHCISVCLRNDGETGDKIALVAVVGIVAMDHKKAFCRTVLFSSKHIRN